MANVKVIKLSTGEDLIGQILDSDESKAVAIANPCQIVVKPKENAEGTFLLGLAPWAPYSKDGVVPIVPSHIVAAFTPDDTMEGEYWKRINRNTSDKQVLNEAKQ